MEQQAKKLSSGKAQQNQLYLTNIYKLICYMVVKYIITESVPWFSIFQITPQQPPSKYPPVKTVMLKWFHLLCSVNVSHTGTHKVQLYSLYITLILSYYVSVDWKAQKKMKKVVFINTILAFPLQLQSTKKSSLCDTGQNIRRKSRGRAATFRASRQVWRIAFLLPPCKSYTADNW